MDGARPPRPELVPAAVEELLRFVQLDSANRDETVFASAGEIEWRRGGLLRDVARLPVTW